MGALLRHQMRKLLEFPHDPVIAEPTARNTCAAIALGLAYLRAWSKSQDSVFVSPSDHVIKTKVFAGAETRIRSFKEGHLGHLAFPYEARYGFRLHTGGTRN